MTQNSFVFWMCLNPINLKSCQKIVELSGGRACYYSFLKCLPCVTRGKRCYAVSKSAKLHRILFSLCTKSCKKRKVFEKEDRNTNGVQKKSQSKWKCRLFIISHLRQGQWKVRKKSGIFSFWWVATLLILEWPSSCEPHIINDVLYHIF